MSVSVRPADTGAAAVVDAAPSAAETMPRDGAQAPPSNAFARWQGNLYSGTVVAEPEPAGGSAAGHWKVSVTTGDGREAEVRVKLSRQFGAADLTPGGYVKRELDAQLRTWPLLAAHEGGSLYVQAPREGQSTRAYWFPPGVPLTAEGTTSARLVFEAAPGQVVRDRTFTHGRGAANLQRVVDEWREQHGVAPPSLGVTTRIVNEQRYTAGELFDVRPYGNSRQLFQVMDSRGRFNLYLQSTRSGETRLIWTQAERPIDVERLAGVVDRAPSAERQAEHQARPFFERVLRGPLRTPLTEKIEQWHSAMRTGDKVFAQTQRDRQDADLPQQTLLEQAKSFTAGAVLGVGKAIVSPMALAPYLPTGNGLTGLPITVEAAQGQAQAQTAADHTSDRLSQQLTAGTDAVARAGGIDPRSSSFKAGETAGEVALMVTPFVKPVFKWATSPAAGARLTTPKVPLSRDVANGFGLDHVPDGVIEVDDLLQMPSNTAPLASSPQPRPAGAPQPVPSTAPQLPSSPPPLSTDRVIDVPTQRLDDTVAREPAPWQPADAKPVVREAVLPAAARENAPSASSTVPAESSIDVSSDAIAASTPTPLPVPRRIAQPSAPVTPPSPLFRPTEAIASGSAAQQDVLGSVLERVHSVATLLGTPTSTAAAPFQVGNLTREEVAALDKALRTPEGKWRLLHPSVNASLQDRFLRQSLLEQIDPSLVDPQVRQLNQDALAELAAHPQPGEAASIKVGYRYVETQPGGAIYRQAIYTQIGQQLAVNPNPAKALPTYQASTPQQVRLYGDMVLREFNNALRRPMAAPQQDAAEIRVLQDANGAGGEVVATNRAGLAERLSNLIDAAGPRAQGVNRVLNVVNPVVLAVGTGKTVFDFTQGRVIPQVNDANAAKLFNVPKGAFVASLTLRSTAAGVPTTFTMYVALGASRNVALLPGQQGGLPRAQIGTDPFTGRKTIGVLSSMNRSAVELGFGANVGNSNLAVMSTNSLRLGVFAANPLRAQVILPEKPDGAGSAPTGGLSASGGTAASVQGVQVSSLTGVRLGPVMYARRIVVPIQYVAQASTEQQTRGLGRNFSFGGFSMSRINSKSDAFVITVNPAFDAGQIEQLIDATKRAGDPAQLEGVLQQLERVGAIFRRPQR